MILLLLLGRCHGIAFSGRKLRGRVAEPVEPISRALGLMAHPLEPAAWPSDDLGVDPLQGGTQLRLVEMAVVDDRAANARIVHLGRFSQRLLAVCL